MKCPFDIDGASLAVTSGIGLSIGCGPGLAGPELLACADAALYEASAAVRRPTGCVLSRLADEPKCWLCIANMICTP